jgi:nucleoside-diphosphate-sugar epimerase
MQVILGSGGAIGVDLARELRNYTNKIRLFSRNPVRINDDDELSSGDLLNAVDVNNAVKECEVAYLTAGIQYNAKIWQQQWPVIMQNVISACKQHNTKLVFFDNIYMYHPDKLNPMTEKTEVFPSSQKGKVRAQIAQMVLDNIHSGELTAIIARSADFYGPGIKNSFFNEAIVKQLKSGKKANWFVSLNHLHNFTFTPDAAKATALLGNTETAYNQVWHLPTSRPLTGKQWIETVAAELGVKPKIQLATKPVIKIMGLFMPIMRESVEMLYQYDRDYVFDSSKIENIVGIKPTPIDIAIKKIVAAG